MRLLLLLGGKRSLSRKADGAPRGAVAHQKPVNDPEAVGTTRRQSSLAGALVVIALGCVALFVVTQALDAWLPNIATSAVAIAVTVAIVDRIVRREQNDRVGPRVKGSLGRLGRLFGDLSALSVPTFWRPAVTGRPFPTTRSSCWNGGSQAARQRLHPVRPRHSCSLASG